MRLPAAAIAAALLSTASARAEGPALIVNSTGRLLDATDKPVDGTPQMTFSFFAAASHAEGESALWSETYTVIVSGGLYAVNLGSTDGGKMALAASLFATTAPVYLEVAVGGETLQPRLRVGAVPVAGTALTALGLACTGCLTKGMLGFSVDQIAAGAVDTDQLKDGSVTNAKLAGGITGDKLAAATVPATALAGGITSDQLAANLDGAKLKAGTVAPAALAGPLGISQVTGLANLASECPANQALVGFDGSLNPKCTSVSALPGMLQVSSALVDFGTVAGSDVTKTLTATNIGSTALSGITVAATAGFTASGCGGALAPGASCTVTFTMPASTALGRVTGWGAVNSASGSAAIALTGTSAPLAPSGTQAAPALSCKKLLADYPSLANQSGVYWLDADGTSGPLAPFQTYCNMADQGGGWTLVARMTKNCMTAVRTPVANVASPTQTSCGKLGDDVINALRTQSAADGIFWGYQDSSAYPMPTTGRFLKIISGFFDAQYTNPSLSQQCSCVPQGPYSATYSPNTAMSGVYTHGGSEGWQCVAAGQNGCTSATVYTSALFLYMHTLGQNGTFPSDSHGVPGGSNGWLYLR